MEPALLAFLLEMAVKLSGLPPVPVEELPPLQPVSRGEMRRTVCPDAPEQCRNLVAMFDTEGYRILYLDSLDVENAADNSFLVHELVHVLQFRRDGDAIYADCRALLKTEIEAYRAQNAYLHREGQFMRVGEVLRFSTCAAEVAEKKPGPAEAGNGGEWKALPESEPWRIALRRAPLTASTWEHPVWQQ